MFRKSPTTAILTVVLGNALLLSACGSSSDHKEHEAAASAAPVKLSEGMEKAIAEYRKYVVDEASQFVKETDAFVKAFKSGDLETAKKLYPTTRMHFERIEPIAESLGDFDPWIDARENDVPENEWRGFHKLEKALWVDGKAAGYEKVADQLLTDVQLLRVKVDGVEIEPALLVTGAVELLNEVSSSKVTGEEERYSHTDLYDFAANVQGAEQIFKVLRSELDKKDAALSKSIETKFAELDKALAAYRQGTDYKPYTELKPEDTKTLSQKLDALAEPLSQLGKVLEG
ncbi:iron uptake system protein EfeO [Gorillibacterium sp. sgz5001074]|uniref:iron uptake system protein EfeO n=1 Tax=Gorillibacterium sp. sgz5001074 TaxID=3446695 RepID=UPI003F67F6EF